MNRESLKWQHYFLIFLTFTFAFFEALLKIDSYDVWFHLGTGKYIVEHMVIPREDVFSHTAYGHLWVTHYWLFDVMLYLAYYLGDFSGMVIFKALLIT